MPQLSLERSIKIHAPALKVWKAFTDPLYTKPYFGGEIVTDWNVGSSYNWKGVDGKTYTHGVILTIEQGKTLQYNLFRSDKAHKAEPVIFSVITYELLEENGFTTLTAKEEFTSTLSEQEYTLAGAAWYEALAKIKSIAEAP